MCGIAGIIPKGTFSHDLKKTISEMSSTLSHRGPDGEGFLIVSDTAECFSGNGFEIKASSSFRYLPSSYLDAARPVDVKLAFAHRRLSILDLSERGHQPMCDSEVKVWITFNGEIYNYKELRAELEAAGADFVSDTDTEVVLHAYKAWGPQCVQRFNGMWAFCIYDTEKNICFASRDRLGVKPFYFINTDELFAFASEQKSFVKSGLIKAAYKESSAHHYLINGALETTSSNFFDGVQELFPGHNLVYSLSKNDFSVERYYKITPTLTNNELSDQQITELVKEKLWNAVRIRMRSDVEVGACLSGGIDSSAICSIMAAVSGNRIHTFTSVFGNESFNEEPYADLVSLRTNSLHHKTEPKAEGFMKEIDDLVYSQDVPIWDSSTYAQFKVMQLARKNEIKVVIDGQGADELFAGYHHHFIAKWRNLKKAGMFGLLKDVHSAKHTISSPYLFLFKETIKSKHNFQLKILKKIFTPEFLNSYAVNNPVQYFDSVNEQLIDDIERSRLKAFLKCEDRCGMWHSVESRTPFSDDVDLINLMFSFDGSRKIQNGTSKYFLREAVKDVIPPEIYSRYDKKGFETPMAKWLQFYIKNIVEQINAADFDFLNKGSVEHLNPFHPVEAKILFKLFILSRWRKVFA